MTRSRDLADRGYQALTQESTGIVSVKDFGAVGDGVQDDTAAIQAALDSGENVFIPKGTYICSDTLTVNGAVHGEGSSSLLKFKLADRLTRLISKLGEGDLRDFAIDGSEVDDAQYAIFEDVEFEPINQLYSNLTISNITSSTTSANGILFYRSSSSAQVDGNFIVERCHVSNISGSSVAKGIVFSFNNEASESNVYIKDNFVDTVTPAADADAIHVSTLNYDNTDPADFRGQAVITRNSMRSSLPMKRGVKVQWLNCKVTNNTVFGDNVTIGYDTYAHGTIFDSNSFINASASSEAFNVHQCDQATISNANIILNNSSAIAVRVQDGSNCALSNIKIDYNGLPVGDTLGIISLQETAHAIATDVTATNINIRCAQRGGIAFLVDDGQLYLSNSVCRGAKTAVHATYNEGGYAKISNCDFFQCDNGVVCLGDSGFTYDIRDSYIIADNIGVYTSYSGSKARLYINNCRINSGSHGILAGADDEIKGCVISKTGAVGDTGAQIGDQTVLANNIITGYASGIVYGFGSVNTIVYGNTTVDVTTPITKNSAVDFVFYENNDR